MVTVDKLTTIDISYEIRKLVPVIGKEKAARLERAYLIADDETRKKIIEMIDTIKAAIFSDKELKDTVLMEPPPREIASKGDLLIGNVLYGKKVLYPFYIEHNMLTMHMGIFGSSGYGKTNLAYWLIKVLSERDIPIIVFDFSKRNYRDLLTLPELKDRIIIYTVGRNVSPFRFNPMRPPEGIQISQWVKEFSEIFDQAYWLLGGGRHLILKALGEIYEKKAPDFPTIFDLKAWLEDYSQLKIPTRERNWLATAMRPMESLCFRETGDVFNCDKGILPSTFFQKGRITILELDALSTNDKTFLIEIILQWIRDWLLVKGEREKLAGVIILEEAHHVLNREKSKRIGMETVIDLIFREVRELGISMVYIDQHPSLISYPALGNTSIHVYMNLGLDTQHASDVMDAKNMLGLSEEDGEYLRRLPVGHAFMLCRQSEFSYPFMIKFPLVKVRKGYVTDDMVRELMLKRMVKELGKESLKVFEEKPSIKESEINEVGWNIIRVLWNCEACTTSAIYLKLNISGRVFKEEVQKLVDMNLVNSKRAVINKKAGIFYFLTGVGESICESKLGKTQFSVGDKDELEKFAINKFTMDGFEYKRTEDGLIFKKKDKKLFLIIENSFDREKVFADISRFVAKDYELHFLCFNDVIRNLVLQLAARYSFEKNIDFMIFVGTLEEYKNDKIRRVNFVG